MPEYYIVIGLVTVLGLLIGCLLALHLEDKRVNEQKREYYRERAKEDKERADEIRKNSPILAALVDVTLDVIIAAHKKK